MKKFWKIVGDIFEWLMLIILAVIFIGGGIYVIKDLFF
jgi:hypothetical protein